ncbi:MATE family efflux transporter [Pseudaestuariivita sp.]|uniref:MATE family efflux transporter n=1 Tax=Pseudaestuariivita sp. TaxID=2211669 RepID=UPI004059E448
MSSQARLTRGPVPKALAAVSAPMSFGIFAVLSVGVADAYFLGQLGGAPLAAIGFIFPVTTAFASLAIGLSAGANAAVSQSLGREDDPEHTRRLGLHAIGIGVLLAALMSVAVWLLYPLLFQALGAEEAALEEIAAYMPVWALSFPFLVLMMIVNAVFRAYGSGISSAAIMVLAAVVNIALDPLLIFGVGPFPELGTQGAAVATGAGRGLAAVVALWYAWRKGMLSLCSDPLEGLWASTKTIFQVGLPAGFSNAINPAGMALVTAAVATVGSAAVAGFGAGTRITSLTNVPMMALSAGIGPVVGQNWGAEKQDRARSGVLWTWGICLVYGLGMGVALAVFAEPLAALITDGGEAAQYTETYLRIAGFSMAGYGMVVCTNAAMNARSKAGISMALSIGRTFLLYLPLAWALVMVLDFTGVVFAVVIANALGAAAAVWCAWYTGLFSPSRMAEMIPSRA